MMPSRTISEGDLLYALPSTGLHTNGYSLARYVLLKHYNVDDYVESIGNTLGDELLSIHKSYLYHTKDILSKDWLVGISHITGGGIVGNTTRILKDSQSLHIDWDSWEIPAIFQLIKDLGDVPTQDMRDSMNLGLGIVYVIKKDFSNEFESHMNGLGEQFYNIGFIK